MTWFYCSFADEDGWLGGLHIEGEDIGDALDRAWSLGVNPGGEVLFGSLPDEAMEKVPDDLREVLLNKEQMMEVFGDVVQVTPGTDVSEYNASAMDQRRIDAE